MERVVLIILDILGGVQTFPTSSYNFTCAEVAFAGRTLNTRIKHTIYIAIHEPYLIDPTIYSQSIIHGQYG